ncbi:hypothetical protein FRC02_006217 [Tulasnella sp. 418]|nr:hypothetical protein FRC02_006217 [Tulasnella sp. 418]
MSVNISHSSTVASILHSHSHFRGCQLPHSRLPLYGVNFPFVSEDKLYFCMPANVITALTPSLSQKTSCTSACPPTSSWPSLPPCPRDKLYFCMPANVITVLTPLNLVSEDKLYFCMSTNVTMALAPLSLVQKTSYSSACR